MRQGKTRKRFLSAIRASLCILTLTACFAVTIAGAEGNATLTETEWSMEPGGTASFSGTFTIEGPDQNNAVLTLELETNEPDNQGTIVFTEINGKTVKIRKRSETQIADLKGDGAENTFQGDWYLPEDTVNLSRVKIRFRAESADGQALASAEMSIGSEEESSANPMGNLLDWTQRLKIILLAAACILWTAAIARSLILKKTNK